MLVRLDSCEGTGDKACPVCPKLQDPSKLPEGDSPGWSLIHCSPKLKRMSVEIDLYTIQEAYYSPFLVPWAPLPCWSLNSSNWETSLVLRSLFVTATPPSEGKNLSWSWRMRFFTVSSFSLLVSLDTSLLNLIMFLVSNTNSSNFALQITLVLVSKSVRNFWNSASQGVGNPDCNKLKMNARNQLT